MNIRQWIGMFLVLAGLFGLTDTIFLSSRWIAGTTLIIVGILLWVLPIKNKDKYNKNRNP
jgi:putative Mn2+ efflux pump MntP